MKTLNQAFVLIASILMILPVQANAGRPQLYQQRLEVGHALLEVQSTNVAEVLPYYTDDIEYHDPIVDIYGIQDMTGFLYQLLGASPDLITTVEDGTLVDGVYMATWTMSGMFNGAPFSAPEMSIVKFVDGTLQSYYSRDYYTEGDIMSGVPELATAVQGFRAYYRCAVDPTFECPQSGVSTFSKIEKSITIGTDHIQTP